MNKIACILLALVLFLLLTVHAQLARPVQTDTKNGVRFVVISADGRTLASVDNDDIKLWDIANGKELRTLKSETSYKYVNAIAFSPDSRRLLSFSERLTKDALNPEQ